MRVGLVEVYHKVNEYALFTSDTKSSGSREKLEHHVPAIRRAQIRPQRLLRTIIQRNRKRRQIKRRRRLLRIPPQQNKLRRSTAASIATAAARRRHVGTERARHAPRRPNDLARDELTVPPPRDLVLDRSRGVGDVSRDLERVFASPAAGFECEDAGVLRAMVRYLD